MNSNVTVKSYFYNKYHNLFLIAFGVFIFYSGYDSEIIRVKPLFMPLGFLSFFCGILFLLIGSVKVDEK